MRIEILMAATVLAACSSEIGFRAGAEPPVVGETPEDPEPPGTVTIEGDCSDAWIEHYELTFLARSGCTFDVDGNLSRRNEHIQARVDEGRFVALPERGRLCSAGLASRGEPVAFDDHLAVLVDDIVLVTGGSGVALDDHPMVGGLPRFDWDDVRGRRFSDRYAPYECLGEGRCDVPRTEEIGPLDVEIDPMTMATLAEALDDDGFEVRIVTFGDDDDGDCAHGELALDLTVTYLP